jgi:hypothetical protein
LEAGIPFESERRNTPIYGISLNEVVIQLLIKIYLAKWKIVIFRVYLGEEQNLETIV